MGMIKRLSKSYRRAVAFLLTAAMTVTNVGMGANVVFAAGEEDENLFLISGADLKEAITSATEQGETFDYASLHLTADKGAKKAYQKLLKGNVYELDVDIDDAYAAEDTSVEVFYNADTEKVIFVYANASEQELSFVVSIDGYETKALKVAAFDPEEVSEYNDSLYNEKKQEVQAEVASETEAVETVKETEAETIPAEGIKTEEAETSEATPVETEAETEAVTTTEAEETETETAAEAEESEKEIETEPEETEAEIETEPETIAAISIHRVNLVGTGSEIEEASEDSTEAEETTEAETEKETEKATEETTEKSTEAVIEESSAIEETTDAVIEESSAAIDDSEEMTDAEIKETSAAETTEAATEATTEPTTEAAIEEESTEALEETTVPAEKPVQPDKDGQMLLNDTEYETLGTLEGKEFENVAIWDETVARAYAVELEDLETIPELQIEKGFEASHKASNGVTITVSAKAGILPEDTTLEVKEMSSAVEDAVQEKLAADGSKAEILAFDITLMSNGEALPNDWSEKGSGVKVTFTGSAIKEKSETATKLQILHADTADGSPIEEATPDMLMLDDEGREQINVENESREEVSFEAEHFSVYVIAFVDENVQTVGSFKVVQAQLGESPDDSEAEANTFTVDSAEPVNMANVVYDNKLSNYTIDEHKLSFTNATVSAEEGAAKIEQIRVNDGVVEYLDGETWTALGEGTVVLWYTDKVAQIGDVQYDTLDDAINALTDGQEIELLADAEMTIAELVKSITIVGNGHRIVTNQSVGLHKELTLKNVKFNFTTTSSWAIRMSNSAGPVLNILDGSECIFEHEGIYSYAGNVINVTASKVFAKGDTYTCMMNETTSARTYLNISEGSEFVIQSSAINGMTSYSITVDASTFEVRNCISQGLVRSNLKLSNNAIADISDNYTGYNMFGGNELIQESGTTLTMNRNKSRALFTQGSNASITIQSGADFIVQENGIAWKQSDDETKHYASKGAITIGVFGWYEPWNKIVHGTANVTFEDGANIDISNNYVRGFSNWGNTYIGTGTRIMNNGMLSDGQTENDCRVATGGGIYNAKTMEIANGVEIYNNHSNQNADDIYNETDGTIIFGEVGSDWYLNEDRDCADQITGWFDDAAATRWNAHKEPYHVMETTAESGSISLTGTKSLKAAHGLVYTVTYDLAGGSHQGSTTVDPEDYPEKADVTVINNPTREGFVFTGWTITTDNADIAAPVPADHAFVMPAANVKLTANWTAAETSYVVNHVYTTTTNQYAADGTLTSTTTVEDGKVADAGRGGKIGSEVKASDYYVTAYNGTTYSVTSTDMTITLVADAEQNVITITYGRTVENKENPDPDPTPTPDPTPDPTPTPPTNGGGGNGGSSSGPNTSTGTTTGGPGVLTTTITPDAVPLANLPESMTDDAAPVEDLITIGDEEVPLAPLPKTGDAGSTGLVFFLSGMMLAAFAVTKRKEDQM